MYEFSDMSPKKENNKGGGNTPTQKSAAKITKKYRACGKRMFPQKREKVQRALYDVCKNSQSIRKAAEGEVHAYTCIK